VKQLKQSQTFQNIYIITVCLITILTIALVRSTFSSQEKITTLRVDVNLVNILCTVQSKQGQLINTLNKNDFLLKEDGMTQKIIHFSREVTLPLTLAVLIDTSPSVQNILSLEQQTAVEFLKSVLSKQDLAMLMNFDRSVSLIQDFTTSVRHLEKAIYSVSIGGGTSLHDAIFLASDEKLKFETGRKAIILISDGADTTSKLKRRDAIEAAQRADTIIYSISNRVGGFFGANRGSPGTLKRYARATGGTAFFPNKPQNFKKAFDAIEKELRSQYLLSYQSSNRNQNGKYRSIKIRLPKKKGLRVKARKGYYASTL